MFHEFSENKKMDIFIKTENLIKYIISNKNKHRGKYLTTSFVYT